MKTLIGYKVVTYTGKSAIINRSDFAVEYKLNEWVYPKFKEAPLMVFRTYDEAYDFRKKERYNHLMIYKCEYKKSKRKWGWCLDNVAAAVILKMRRKRASHLFQELPAGTIFADAVKLIGVGV